MAWMRPRVLSYDPDTGIRELFHYDPDEDRMAISVQQDVKAIVEFNKARMAQTNERARWGSGKHVAKIPLIVLAQLQKAGILRDQKKFKAWLNDKYNEWCRIFPGKV